MTEQKMPKVKLNDFVGKKGYWLHHKDHLEVLKWISEQLKDLEVKIGTSSETFMNLKGEIYKELEGGK